MNFADRLGGRRALQIGVLSAALVIVLGFLALDTIGRPQDTRAVWVMTHSVQAGTTLDNSSVREERIPATRDPYSYLASAPLGHFAAHSLSSGDILRDDDVETSPLVEVPIKLGGFQGSAGDSVDIYAIEGGRATLVGRGVTVISGNTIQVPASDEPLWIAVYGSSTSLVGARSNGTGVPDAAAVSGVEAARRLAILAQQGGASASP